jgi:hypothetical protein
MRRWAALVIVWGLGVVSGSMVGWTSALFTSTTSNPANSFAAAASFCSSPGGQTVSTDRDTYVRQDQLTNNFGTANDLYVQSRDGSRNRRTLVYMPLPSKPSGCVISSAILRLYATAVTSGRTIEAYRAAASWTETGVNWNTQPATVGGAATSDSGSTIGWKEWNVTAQVDLMYTGSNNGFLLKDATENLAAAPDQIYQSREGGTNDPELIVSFAGVACSSPGSQTVTANLDSWIEEKNPTTNFGTALDIFVQSKATAENRRLLVKFTLPSQPANCSVSVAVLRLNASATQSGRTIQVFRAAASWTETGVTWSNQPATDGSASTYSPTANGWHEAIVTARVQELYSDSNNGFILRDQTENSAGTFDQKYDSRENTNDPELRITFG